MEYQKIAEFQKTHKKIIQRELQIKIIKKIIDNY